MFDTHMNEKNCGKVPVFENGLAQPVFPITDGKTEKSMIRNIQYRKILCLCGKRIMMWTEMEKEIL